MATTDLSAGSGSTILCPSCRGPAFPRWVQKNRKVLECSAALCGLRFLHPQPTAEELAELYRSAYYEPGAPNQDNTYVNTPEQVATELTKTILGHCGPLAGRRILDFGAGIGVLAEQLRSLGAAVVCVEPDPEARREAANRGLTSYASLEALRAGEAAPQFDLITAIEVVEHLEDPVRYLELLREFIAPGGALFLTTPNFQSLQARLRGCRWQQYQNPTHLFYFTGRSLERALHLAGFRSVVRLRTRVVYPRHGTLRRVLQRTLQLCGLDGDLLVLSSPAAPSAPTRMPLAEAEDTVT
jgi:2-polyprenyl-3-methyl-5-hydroxy-6-metoxy-1,4-benzoquinol methylase